MTVLLGAPTQEVWEDEEIAWTDEEIAGFERPGYKVEVIDGSLHVTPPANEWHQEVEERAKVAIRLTCPPGWRVRHQRGVMADQERFIPDVAVLIPDAPVEPEYLPAKYVALAVEVESRWTRKDDRGSKSIAYAEAGIQSYWRIERGSDGPIVHIYELPAGERAYLLVASVRPGERFTVQKPFLITIDPDELARDLV